MAISRAHLEETVAFMEANEIKPEIAETFPFEGLVDAFTAISHQKMVGKIAVHISNA